MPGLLHIRYVELRMFLLARRSEQIGLRPDKTDMPICPHHQLLPQDFHVDQNS
jgi:hypothetical protein